MTDDGQRDPMKPGSYGGEDMIAQLAEVVTHQGYSLDPDGLNHMAKEFDALAAVFRLGIEDARVIARTDPPGLDYASGNNAETFRNSGGELVKSLEDRVQYCKVQAAKFRKAAGAYAEAEDTHSTEMNKLGGHL